MASPLGAPPRTPLGAPLAVVIVHRDQAARCLTSVQAFLDQDVPVEITVVDNASRDDELARLRAGLPPAVEVVALSANLGFGPAANVGLRRWLEDGHGEWAAVAPHDALPAPGCVRALLDAVARRPRAGLASAEYGDGAKPVVDPYFGGILGARRETHGWEDAGHPHGTLMVVRRACALDVGLFDERYFAYCEEADLAVRARRAGWEVGIVWGAEVVNPSLSLGTPIVEYLQLRNTLLLVREHFGRYKVTIRLLMAVGDTAYRWVQPSRRTAIFSARARALAMADFLRGRYGAPPLALARG